MRSVAMDTVRKRQLELGQFFTPTHIAGFMASLFDSMPPRIRLLDAGAGNGALTEALVRRCCENGRGIQSIDATLYELDPAVLDPLHLTLRECERCCANAGIRFSFDLRAADFIEEMSLRLSNDLFESTPPAFEIAVSNPPYRKIGVNSPQRLALRRIGVETSNLYTGFISLILRLLADNGQLVAITPRSFCNGPYFRPFREDLLARLDLRRIHVFESRNAAFRADEVLQENVIFHGTRNPHQRTPVVVSWSTGEPNAQVQETRVPLSEVVDPQDSDCFIHIPTSARHDQAKATMKRLGSSLRSLGLMVSTGRVVDFRLRESLRSDPGDGTVPLIYPCHFHGGTIHWPRTPARKPNAILDTPLTRPWLVPSGRYVLTKRFTSKEENRRLVACVLDPDRLPAAWIGLENHLNYFHANGAGLDRELAAGLYAFLNSTVVDQYFRRFSGHTQINATDLRSLAYPDRDTLRAIGRDIQNLDLDQLDLDARVEHHLNASQASIPKVRSNEASETRTSDAGARRTRVRTTSTQSNGGVHPPGDAEPRAQGNLG